MRRANEPVLVRHIELGRIPPIRKNSRTSDERRIMEIDHIEATLVEYLPEAIGIRERTARLLCENRGHDAELVLETNDPNTVIFLRRFWRTGVIDCFICIDVVHNGDIMASLDQTAREALDTYRIATKAVRRIKRRREAEL